MKIFKYLLCYGLSLIGIFLGIYIGGRIALFFEAFYFADIATSSDWLDSMLLRTWGIATFFFAPLLAIIGYRLGNYLWTKYIPEVRKGERRL